MKYQSSNTKLIYDIDFDLTRKLRYLCPECADQRKKSKEKDLEFYPDKKGLFVFIVQLPFLNINHTNQKNNMSVPNGKTSQN